MQFESIHGEDLGAPVLDVVQEAVDATATIYTRSPEVDVDRTLDEQLRGRGVRPTSDAVVAEIAHAIRSGHEVELGEHDGSIE